ncbi:MAG: TolC family outer membrane protein [Pseudomonadota bacterium]
MRQNFGQRLVRCAGATAMIAGLLGSTVQADSLADALVGAYNTSGLLEQNRALLRAADEDVATAAAALKPIIDYSAGLSRNFGDSQGFSSLTGLATTSNLEETVLSTSIIGELLLYDGGVSVLAREAAKETVLATRQELISVEQDVLFRAVSAFLNVVALREFVELRENNLRLLQQELQAAEDRFEVGEVTRTDVAQAESSLADSRSGLATAQGDLQQAVEEYRNVVGRTPGELDPLPNPPSISRSVDDARAFAVRTHPDLKSAQFQVAAAELNIQRAEAELNPRVIAGASLGLSDGFQGNDFTRSGSLSLSLTGPIYQGGALSSGIRSAMASRDAQRGNLLEVRKTIVQDVGDAYANLSAQRASLEASEEQIRASRIAFEGVREEAALGARTTLDVLDAEQDLLDAETARISAEANLYIASYAVLQSEGRLTAQQLGLPVQIYDPTEYYNLVKDAPVPTSRQGQQLDKVLRALQK